MLLVSFSPFRVGLEELQVCLIKIEEGVRISTELSLPRRVNKRSALTPCRPFFLIPFFCLSKKELELFKRLTRVELVRVRDQGPLLSPRKEPRPYSHP